MSAFKLFVPSEGSGDDGITVLEVVTSYLAALKSRVDASDYAADGYANICAVLSKFATAHPIPASECRQKDLQKWLAANPQWKKPKTRKNVIGAVIGCFKWAADEEGGDLLHSCPYKIPKSLRGLPYEPRRPALHSEYVTLMRHGSKPLRRALFFLRRSGARTKEMRELDWSQIVLDGGPPHIIKNRHKTRRTSGKPRKIGLDASTANWFRAMKRNAGNPATGFVFVNCDGGPWDRHTFAQHFRRYARALGLDNGVEELVSAYCLRHTYTVDGIEANISSRRIADQLGHAKTDMIDAVYGRHTRDREKHLADVAGDVLAKRKREVKRT